MEDREMMKNPERLFRKLFNAFEQNLDAASKSMTEIGYDVKYWKVTDANDHNVVSCLKISNSGTEFVLTECRCGSYCVVYQIDDECYMFTGGEMKEIYSLGEKKHSDTTRLLEMISDFLKIFEING